MGFLDKLRGRPAAGDGGRPPGGPPPARDDARGVPLTTLDVDSGPFPKRLRVRAVYEAYSLVGSWQVVSLNAPADWVGAQEQVRQAYYQQFGLIRLPDGKVAIRWNENIWRNVRDSLQILRDARFDAGEGASSTR